MPGDAPSSLARGCYSSNHETSQEARGSKFSGAEQRHVWHQVKHKCVNVRAKSYFLDPVLIALFNVHDFDHIQSLLIPMTVCFALRIHV